MNTHTHPTCQHKEHFVSHTVCVQRRDMARREDLHAKRQGDTGQQGGVKGKCQPVFLVRELVSAPLFHGPPQQHALAGRPTHQTSLKVKGRSWASGAATGPHAADAAANGAG
eukprot:scaffold249056_cov16-Tisochrysis_lutea.AAC.1